MTRSTNAKRTGLAAAAVAMIAGVAGVQDVARATPEVSAAIRLTVQDFQLPDQTYFGRQLYRLGDAKAVVLISYASGDATVRRDAAAWMALKTAYAGKGVEFLALASRLGETRERVIPDAKAAGLEMPILFDAQQLVGEQLDVTRAAEVIVIDPRTWRVAWRGPVAAGAADAIAALSAGQPVTVASRPALGGGIAFPERARAGSFAKISYAGTVAPIVQAKCAGCHQPGGIGPMALNSYEQIKGFSPMIREVLRMGRMPPFQPDRTVGHFRDDARLSPDEIKTLVHWIDAGSPRGAGDDPLRKIKFQAPEWPLGTPDKIVEIPAVKIPASGVLDYQYPMQANVMTEGRWLKATAFQISDRQAVHHILTGVAPADAKPGTREGQWSALLHGYVPGVGYMKTAEGTGIWVPPSSGLAFQAHYTTYGRETVEKTRVGMYFYPKGEVPKFPRRTFGIFDFSIMIPPGEAEHQEIASIVLPKDAVIYAFTPHAHKRGAAANVSIRYPNGREEMLLAIPRYDFGWQYDYVLEKPLAAPAGSRIITRWVYDNSARNPGNPDPTRMVPWGEQSFDEMLAVYIHYHWVGETAKAPRDDYDQLMQQGLMMGVMDDNMDGKLQVAELKGQMGENLKKYAALIDKDKDGALSQAELDAAMKLLPRGRRGGGGTNNNPAQPMPVAVGPAVGPAAGPGGR
jgi:mono/diheme cytochrome c family protein